MNEVYKKLVEGLREYFKESGKRRAVLGVSGGLDSAVTLALACEALGGENVGALLMPERGLTKSDNIIHAQGLADFFGAKSFKVSINNFLIGYAEVPWKQGDMAYMNTKARVRANLLYNYANTFDALVLGTSNRSELMLGYGTKHGDLAADVLPIGSLYKTEVVELAESIELPREIIDKVPSAELFEGQTDEKELGAGYDELDNILKKADEGEEALVGKGINSALVRSVFRRIQSNKHKLEVPPIIQST